MRIKNSHYYRNLFLFAFKNIRCGLKSIEKNIESENIEKQILYLGIRRFISHAEAIILLCKKKYTTEALMVLRAILELVVNMRWVLEDTSKNNLKIFLEHSEYEFQNGMPKMGEYWTDKNLLTRMTDIGFDETYYKMVVKKLHEEIHGNPSRIARSYGKSLSAMNAESIYSIASQFAGQLMKVANFVFNGKNYFIDHNKIFTQIHASKWHLNKKVNA